MRDGALTAESTRHPGGGGVACDARSATRRPSSTASGEPWRSTSAPPATATYPRLMILDASRRGAVDRSNPIGTRALSNCFFTSRTARWALLRSSER